MHLDLNKIERFYQTDIGAYAAPRLRDVIQKLLSSNGGYDRHTVIASASAFLFSEILDGADRYCLHSHHEQGYYPGNSEGHYIVCDREALPFRAESVDCAIVFHDIELSENPEVYLREIWRVLKGEGQLIIVFPNRAGKWARFDNTPFGRGYPYSFHQMKNLLSKTHFAVEEVDGALYFPPYPPKTNIARLYRWCVDKVGKYCLFEPGVIALSACKHVYAPTRGLGATAAEKAAQVLFPSPVKSGAQPNRKTN